MEHIAELGTPILERLLNGDMKLTMRFSRSSNTPYDQVNEDDVIYFKSPDGYAVARAKVAKVERISDLTPDRVMELVEKYKDETYISPLALEKQKYSKYVTLIWFSDLHEIRPFKVKLPNGANSKWLTVDDVNKYRY